MLIYLITDWQNYPSFVCQYLAMGIVFVARSCIYRNRSEPSGPEAARPLVEPCPRFAHQLVFDHVRKVRPQPPSSVARRGRNRPPLSQGEAATGLLCCVHRVVPALILTRSQHAFKSQ